MAEESRIVARLIHGWIPEANTVEQIARERH